MVVVHVASVQDYDGGQWVLERLRALQTAVPRLQVIWADNRYLALVAWVTEVCTWMLEVVRKLKGQHTFVVLPHRWIVERTFGWFGHFRRLDKDHEELLAVSEAMCYWAMVHLMARRLTHGQTPWRGP
jgi:putative transposase